LLDVPDFTKSGMTRSLQQVVQRKRLSHVKGNFPDSGFYKEEPGHK